MKNDSRDVVLIRHAQTEWNRERRFQGHLDSPVTAEGLAQIRAVADRLRSSKFDAVYTSDLGRSVLTADRISRAVRAPVVIDVRLRERGHGLFEGRSHQFLNENYPEWVQRVRQNTDPDFAVPGAESKRDLHKRIMPAMDEAAHHPGSGNVIIVGHGGLLRVFLNHVTRQPLTASNGAVAPNCSISIVENRNGQWRVKTIGDTDHLPVLA